MVFVRYEDVPGQIGRLGAAFGDAGVNIANIAVSRTRQGGTALMALSIDTPAEPALIQGIEKAGFADARFINLGLQKRKTYGMSAAVARWSPLRCFWTP